MIATATRKPLGQLLLDRGIIAPEQLQRALDEQRHSNSQKLLGEIFVERGMATRNRSARPSPTRTACRSPA
jgi:type IV pilus assembly protein PilB